MNKTAQILINIIVGIFAFIFFVILLFPLDSVISHYLAKLEKETKGEYRISISSLDASLIFDTTFKDFRLYQKGKEIFFAPTIDAGISIFALLSNSINVDFSAEYKRGEISGRILLSEDESVYDIDFNDVNLDELTFLNEVLVISDIPLSLSGMIDGNVYLSLTRDIKSSEGKINLKISNSKLNSISIKSMGLEIPALLLSDKSQPIEIEGILEKAQITVSKLNIPGPDLMFKLNGTVKVNRQFALLRSSFEGYFSFADTVAQELPFLLLIEKQKNEEGFFPVNITGNLKRPKIMIGEMELSKILKL